VSQTESLKQYLLLIRVIAAAVLASAPARAINPHKLISQYVQSVWTSQSGLLHNVVFSITQTTRVAQTLPFMSAPHSLALQLPTRV